MNLDALAEKLDQEIDDSMMLAERLKAIRAALAQAERMGMERAAKAFTKGLANFDDEGFCLSCGDCIEAHEQVFKCP